MSGEREGGSWEVRRREGGSAAAADERRSNRAGREQDEDPDEEVEVRAIRSREFCIGGRDNEARFACRAA
eukprot:2695884-Rhodomonas_salina.3